MQASGASWVHRGRGWGGGGLPPRSGWELVQPSAPISACLSSLCIGFIHLSGRRLCPSGPGPVPLLGAMPRWTQGAPSPEDMEQPSSEAGQPPPSPLTIASCGQRDVGSTVPGVSAWAVFLPGPGPQL